MEVLQVPSFDNFNSSSGESMDGRRPNLAINCEHLFGEVTESVYRSSGILGDLDSDAWKFIQVPSFDGFNSSSRESMDDGQDLAITIIANLEFAKPWQVLGKLTVLPGSISDLTICLENYCNGVHIHWCYCPPALGSDPEG
jgi:hypothetical protein